LFFDEIESLVPVRSAQEAGSFFPRLVSQLFRELDDLHGSLGVVVLGATNRPELMEPALLRAGRFDYVIELPLPNRDERREILRIHTKGLTMESDANLGELAETTAGWTGAGLELLCKKAAILAWEECREAPSREFRVSARHLREAQTQVRTMT
jgi:transitional endoplasmic reticulum ATPase